MTDAPSVSRRTAGASGPPGPQLAPKAIDPETARRAAQQRLNSEPSLSPLPQRPRKAWTSLLRFRAYLEPYVWRYVAGFIFAVVSVGTSVVVPLVTRAVIDGPIANSDRPGLYALGAVAMALGVLEAVLMWARRWVISYAGMGAETAVRDEIYARLQRLPMGFHSAWQSGQLLSRITSDLSVLRRFINFGIIFLIVSIAQILAVIALLMNLYWPLGIVVALSIIPIAWLCAIAQRKMVTLSRQIQDQTGDVASAVEESAQSLRVIKSFGREEHVRESFDERAVTLFRTSVRRVRLTAWFWTFLEVIPNATLIVVLGIGAYAAADGHLTIGTLAAFITLLLSLIWPVASLGMLLTMMQESMTAADRIAEVLDSENDIQTGEARVEEPKGHVRLEGVHFRFPDGAADVLDGVDLDIQPGETIALVGGTGAGKTVLTSLIPRLHDATAGRVMIDGIDVRDMDLEHLRTMVATAFEDPTLFSMSARENLTLGRTDASDEDIARAIDVAQAHFVHDLPWGLDTRIGEQGMSLSGGQRQRLALARAVITNPAVLVLDDTLSALDIHTEALVEEALSQVLLGVTGIIVAHRASTVLLADRVVMLQEGKVHCQGKHHDLLERYPAYRDLMSAEFDAEGELGLQTDDRAEGAQKNDTATVEGQEATR